MQRFPRFYTLIVFLISGALIVGCASTQKMAEPSPAGEWSYVVKNTPQGDVTGDLMITLIEGVYTGEISASELNQVVPLSDLTYEGTTFSFAATFDANGQLIPTKTTVEFAVDTMMGTMDVTDFGEFSFSATRKKAEQQ